MVVRGFLLLVGVLTAPLVPAPHVTVTRLRPGGWIVGRLWADLDGDGRPDLLLQTITPRGRALALFRQRAEGFAPRPDQVLRIPRDALAYTAGPLGPTGRGAVLFLTAAGVRAHPWAGEGLAARGEVLFPFPFFPACPHPVRCYAWPFAADLNDDGRLDLLLPTRGAYQVFHATGRHGYAAGPRLAVPAASAAAAAPGSLLTTTLRQPLPHLADADGDGRLDVLFFWGGEIRLHRQGPRGLPPRPSARARPPWLTAPGGGLALDRLVLADVDGDHRADLLLVRKRGRVGLFTSLRTQVLFCRGPFLAKKRPDQVLNFLGLARRPRLVDFDGDGRLDLALATLEVNLATPWRELAGGGLPARFAVLPFRAEQGGFAPEPLATCRRRLAFAALLRYRPVPLVRFGGDFDGDGRGDLLMGRPGGGFEARRGGEEDPGKVLFAVPRGNLEHTAVVDLSGEGCPDVVTYDGEEATVVLCR